jgi:hypothetical protein
VSSHTNPGSPNRPATHTFTRTTLKRPAVTTASDARHLGVDGNTGESVMGGVPAHPEPGRDP